MVVGSATGGCHQKVSQLSLALLAVSNAGPGAVADLAALIVDLTGLGAATVDALACVGMLERAG